MAALQVRDLPQALYEDLSEAAQRDHRSLAQETTYIIERYLAEGRGEFAGPRGGQGADRAYAWHEEAPDVVARRAERHRRILAELEAMGPMSLSGDAPVAAEVVRELRDAR